MTRDAFHQELREIEESVLQMANLVEDEIALAMQALGRRDTVIASEVLTSDGAVNEMQRRIRSRCIDVMARQAPVARDLRELTTVELVINELERMGDHAVDIAKQSLRLREHETAPHATEMLLELATIVRDQLRRGIQAFVDVNVQSAREICARDDEVDLQYRTIFDQLLVSMSADPNFVSAATCLLFVAHDLERIGDRVTNIGEDIVYMVTGEIEELN